jgi:hypothetical protein
MSEVLRSNDDDELNHPFKTGFEGERFGRINVLSVSSGVYLPPGRLNKGFLLPHHSFLDPSSSSLLGKVLMCATARHLHPEAQERWNTIFKYCKLHEILFRLSA